MRASRGGVKGRRSRADLGGAAGDAEGCDTLPRGQRPPPAGNPRPRSSHEFALVELWLHGRRHFLSEGFWALASDYGTVNLLV